MTTLTWKPGTLLPYTSLWLTLRKLAHLNKLRISDFPLSEDFSPRAKRAQSQSRSVQNVDLRVLARLMGEPVQFFHFVIIDSFHTAGNSCSHPKTATAQSAWSWGITPDFFH